jgi:hypothetical protein
MAERKWNGLWHVAGDGKPGKCHAASEASCPFRKTGHYDSLGKATEAAEKIAEALNSPSLKKMINGDDSAHDENSLLARGHHQRDVLRTAVKNKTSINGMDLENRKDYVEKVIAKLNENKQDSQNRYSTVENGTVSYDPDREAMHREIIESFINDAVKRGVPAEGRALFSGGLGGAGKSYVLKHGGYHPDKYLTINNDDIKEELAKRGAVPKVLGLTPMEASSLVHEEASDIMKKLMRTAEERKLNVIIDGTLGSTRSAERKIRELRSAGYTSVRAVFVDIDPDTSKKRAQIRYKDGMDRYTMGGSGSGGRWLPLRIIDDNRSEDSRFSSKNAENLTSLYSSGLFDEKPEVWDNNVDGRQPVRVDYDDFSGDVTDLVS